MIPVKNLLHSSQKKALKAFKRFAKNVPFYRRYLQKSNISPSRIRTLDDFKLLVPILDKESLFAANLRNIKEIFPKHSLNHCRSVLPSSGFSGKLSFGINTKKDSRSQEKHIDMMLDYVFDVRRKKTLLINALSMGINVPTRRVTTINTGPREDMIIALVEVFAKEYDQTIIIGDNYLIKNTIEQGIEYGIDWPRLRIRLVLGGGGFPENFRSYLAHLMGVDMARAKEILIASSFGIAEIGLNILWESTNTIAMRRAASLDSKFRTALLGQEEKLCPMLFQYNPLTIHIEESNGRLLFTNLNPNAIIPIVRYASGDHGIIIPHERIVKALKTAGFDKYIPRLPIPIVAVKERLQPLNLDGRVIFPRIIKNAIYSDFGLPALTTGYFVIAESQGKLLLEIQLKEGAIITDELRKRFEIAIASYVRDVHFELVFYPYREFQCGMGLDYERKFQHMRHRHHKSETSALTKTRLEGILI